MTRGKIDGDSRTGLQTIDGAPTAWHCFRNDTKQILESTLAIVLVAAGTAFGAIVALAALYRAAFALAYALRGPRICEEHPIRLCRFLIVVPAHNEVLLIGELIASIRESDYPPGKLDIIVVADNCTDATAARVRQLGEIAISRTDPENPGKGQALDWILSKTDLSPYDAVAFFDADNLVDSAFFQAMNRELNGGGRCLQGYYDIANPIESPLTRLVSITYLMKNLFYNAGKRCLGLSVSLMGTGMVFSTDVIRTFGWKADTIGEDLEQTFNLLDGDERIFFVYDARTRAQESSTFKQARPQRQRWATGRRALRSRAWNAIATGLRQRSFWRIDAGIDVLLPSYSKLAYLTVLSLVAAVALLKWSVLPMFFVGAAIVSQTLEFSAAIALLGSSRRQIISALAFAPIFLLWKAIIDGLAIVGYRRTHWARTDRTPHHSTERPSDQDS